MIPKNTIIETNSYWLRIPDETDIDFVFSATRYPNFNQGMQWSAPMTKEELLLPLKNNIENWEKGICYSFTILSKKGIDNRVGRISIRETEKNMWEVGFWTHPIFQNNGVISEVLKAIVDFAFSKLDAIKVKAKYAIWNKASEKVLIKNGFKFEKHIEKGFVKEGKWICENEFSIAKQQSIEQRQKNNFCDFCEKLKNSQNTVFETPELIVMLDIDPISLGHVLICPKSHYDDFHEMPDELIQEMMTMAKRYINSLNKLFQIRGYSMMLNAGEFNDIHHCHLHVFPRYAREEFQWTFNEEHVSRDATRFQVLKKLLLGNI